MKYYVSFQTSKYQGYDSVEVFDTKQEVIDFILELKEKDNDGDLTYSVMYGKYLNLEPKEKVVITEWKLI